ncbi:MULTISPECIES: o-succinylbenzoate--CoA ligase [Actinoalloteichus]|uniref:Acyl-CoA synthetase (AMP-forming)/AMP-acid ligase II n=1 Tax=Actinoalloteichus fjordicus TaxID=1612552 RepID=A0AAC9LA36_9PSEU|nr:MULTISPECIES: o-succinylbenzoate--CoA ligase [Actinoalloteichus]APU12584.1 acyl-CoA synthetase (AMP-forming)/AMP-acid ligase II [Actinoalloteichus fjordicus]APU18537.1 acyl-CoA synthetase (AMP-forming)/AMP-acid ligase II [Actinoalloteichus sp. GBA129-24]
MTRKSLVALDTDHTARTTGLVVDAVARALDGGPALLPLPADPEDERARLVAALRPDQPVDDDAVAVIVPTSGSTGTPKGVLLTAAALRASATATHDRLGGAGRWLLALPVRHIAGIQVVTRSLLAGAAPVVLDSAAGFRPDRFAAAAQATLADGGRCYTSLVPTQLSRLVTEGGAGLAALRRFDAVLCGGAATPPALLARALAEGVAVRTTYGMSETAGGCVYDGLPLADVGVRPAPGTGPAPVALAGPMLALGYRLDPEGSAAAFVDGWFQTGDLGEVDEHGVLQVLGRADDLINSGGVKIAPVLVEQVLTAQPGVAEACVVGLGDPEWGELVAAVVVPVDAASPPETAGLLAAVRDRLGAASTPKICRVAPSLPVRGPGKVDRLAVRALLLDRRDGRDGRDG